MPFKAVSSQVNLPEMEEKINQFWKEEKIFERSVEEKDPDSLFVFVDGPPFVSGLPHYGHMITSIAKDMVPRYQTMLGKRVRRVWGWDCHGLPIEDKVNQKFGILSSTQLENEMGVEKYVQECRKYVQGVTSDWQWYVEKIGRWVDMENAYYTMDLKFMESVIWGFKQMYDKGLIYKGKRVSLYSTDTSTPVSNFEVAMDADNYQDVDDLSVFVKFKVENSSAISLQLSDKMKDKDVYFVAWTTTPWTIPANFALAVNANFEYVLVEYEKELYIVAKERIHYTFGASEEQIGHEENHLVKVLDTFKGLELEGIEYEQVYEFLKSESENDFKVYLSDDVTIDEGTGVLHIAPAFGEVDFNLGQKYKLTALNDIDNEGKMTLGDWKGVYLRDASPIIAEDMQKNGFLLRSEVYKHRLPFYRGKNPLIYMAQDSYFINVQKIKDRMMELNKKINWIPKHIKNGRFAQTIETSPDWSISRNRYWATIMPIWRSDDGDELVVGSIEEMMEYTDQITKRKAESGKGKDEEYFFEGQPMDLHRDICDKVVLKKDGKEYRRIPEVLDCWMDSGSVPFAEYHYPFENKDVFEKSKPADFIIEYTPQVRAWFNVLHRISTMLFDDIAFKTAICHGTLAGTDGRKMSKSFGNYPDPKIVLEKYGGDTVRLYLMSSAIIKGEDGNFNEEQLQENYRFLLIYWNCYKYFVDYASIFGWSCYVPGGDGQKDKLNVLDKWILSKLTKLIFELKKAFDGYDLNTVTKLSKSFIQDDFSTWYLRRSRDRVASNDNEIDRNVCLAVMYGVLVGFTKATAPLIPFITEEIYKNLTDDVSVHLVDYPKGDASLIDDELMEDMAVVRQIVELGHAKRKEAGIKLRQPLGKLSYAFSKPLSSELEQIAAEELNVKEVVFREAKSEDIEIELNLDIDDELREEGEARELIRQIQQLRKEAGLTLKDKIDVEALSWPKKYEGMILKMTSAASIKIGDALKIDKIS